MDTDLLVENKIEDGTALIRQLMRDRFSVTVAFWVRRTEAGLWYLYIATSSVSAEKLNEAYRIVYAALSEIPECSVLPSEIKVITFTDSIALAAVALRDRNPNPIREPKFYRGIRLGNLTSEELCMYPRRFPLEVREVTNGPWQVLINKPDDVWLTCDSEDDARTIAKASVLEDEALELQTSDEELAAELEKTADAMERYRMGFGSRSLKRRAQEVRQLSKVKGASQVAN